MVQIALVAWHAALPIGQELAHVADARAMIIDAGEQHRASRRAGGRDVEVAEEHALCRQRVEVRCRDLTAERAEITPAHVIGDDHQHVGAYGGGEEGRGAADQRRCGQRSGGGAQVGSFHAVTPSRNTWTRS